MLELLKEMAPHVARVAILSNPDVSQANWHASVAPAAARLAVEVVEAPLRDSNEIEAAMAQWGRQPNYGLIVPGRLTTGPSMGEDVIRRMVRVETGNPLEPIDWNCDAVFPRGS